MDVQLPDGTVIKGVPDGMSKGQLLARLKSNGYDISKLMGPQQSKWEQTPPLAQKAGFVEEVLNNAAQLNPAMMIAKQVNKANSAISDAAYEVGGRVSDVAGPAAGTVANVALQSVPMMIGGGAGGAVGKTLEPAMQQAGRNWMQRALKPTWEALDSGDAAKAIDTMLKNGVNATPGGVAAMKAMIGKLKGEVDDLLRSSTATVDTRAAAQRAAGALERASNQVNKRTDTGAVVKAWQEFLEDYPKLIPVQKAQKLKTGTYQKLADDYGELTTASKNAQKDIARGLKEGIADAVPGVAAKNEAMSELLNAAEVAKRRAMMAGNHQVLGISAIAPSEWGLLASLADRSPLVASLLARGLYSGSKLPEAAGTIVGAAAPAKDSIQRVYQDLQP